MVYVPYEAAEWYVLKEYRIEKNKAKPGSEPMPPTNQDALLVWWKWLEWIPRDAREFWKFYEEFPLEFSSRISCRPYTTREARRLNECPVCLSTAIRKVIQANLTWYKCLDCGNRWR